MNDIKSHDPENLSFVETSLENFLNLKYWSILEAALALSEDLPTNSFFVEAHNRISTGLLNRVPAFILKKWLVEDLY